MKWIIRKHLAVSISDLVSSLRLYIYHTLASEISLFLFQFAEARIFNESYVTFQQYLRFSCDVLTFGTREERAVWGKLDPSFMRGRATDA
jgi:hypothetical protein